MIPSLGLGSRPVDTQYLWQSPASIISKSQVSKLCKFVQNSTKIPTPPPRPLGPQQRQAPIFASREQRRVINIVSAHCESRKVGISPPPPLKLLIVGESGSGKTFLIKEITRVLQRHLANYTTSAFTGRASHSIGGGVTLHHLLGRNRYSGSLDEVETPNYSVPQQTWVRLRQVQYIIIDEIYMTGLRFFKFLDQLLRRVQCKPELPFGGVSILALGDSSQLSAICDVPFHSKLNTKETEDLIETRDIFRRFETHVLKGSYRSQSAEYLELLHRFRFKRVTREDVQLLRTRTKSRCTQEVIDQFEGSVRVFSSNYLVESWARDYLLEKSEPVLRLPTLYAPIRPPPHHLKNTSDYDLFLHLNCPVILTENLDVIRGLTNGALGRVKGVLWESGRLDYPAFIVVEFENYKFTQLAGGGIPIPIRTDVNNYPDIAEQITSSRFPLKQAYSLTLHKVQGSTLDRIVVEFGNTEAFSNFSYVALSRVSDLSKLLINDQYLPLERFSGPSFIRDWEDQLAELRRIRAVGNTREVSSSTSVAPRSDILPTDLVVPSSASLAEPSSSTVSTTRQVGSTVHIIDSVTPGDADWDLLYPDWSGIAADFEALIADIQADPADFDSLLPDIEVDPQPSSSTDF